jgi:hypothetical protein
VGGHRAVDRLICRHGWSSGPSDTARDRDRVPRGQAAWWRQVPGPRVGSSIPAWAWASSWARSSATSWRSVCASSRVCHWCLGGIGGGLGGRGGSPSGGGGAGLGQPVYAGPAFGSPGGQQPRTHSRPLLVGGAVGFRVRRRGRWRGRSGGNGARVGRFGVEVGWSGVCRRGEQFPAERADPPALLVPLACPSVAAAPPVRDGPLPVHVVEHRIVEHRIVEHRIVEHRVLG